MKSIFIETEVIESQLKAKDFLGPFFEIQCFPMNLNSVNKQTEFMTRRYFKKKVEEFKKQTQKDTFFYLIQENNKWILLDEEQNSLAIDFDEDHLNYRRKPAGKSDLLLKAIGKKSKNILDVSCGLGIDSVFLLGQGLSVESFERNPLVYFLLSQAKLSSSRNEIKSWPIHFLDAQSDSLDELIKQKTFDVIYFDPMFPEKKKTALSKQEMQLFKNLVGADEDAVEILKKILNYGIKIVVKRPLRSEFLLEKPKMTFEGNSIRFEVY